MSWRRWVILVGVPVLAAGAAVVAAVAIAGPRYAPLWLLVGLVVANSTYQVVGRRLHIRSWTPRGRDIVIALVLIGVMVLGTVIVYQDWDYAGASLFLLLLGLPLTLGGRAWLDLRPSPTTAEA